MALTQIFRIFGLQWHVTNNCDQRCWHCYIWRKYEEEGLRIEPTIQQCYNVVCDFIDFCREVNARPYFSITGGDPLLYPHIWELLSYIHEKQIHFTILGNPFNLTPETAKRLKNLGCLSYQMSLDGLEETHDNLRKFGSFRATLDALPLLREVGIRSMIMSTVSLVNYEEISSVARLCVEHQVGNFAFARFCPQREGDAQYNMSPQQYKGFLSEMWQVYSELVDKGTRFSLKDHLWVPFLYEKGMYHLKDEKGIVFDGCNCAIKHITLLPNGTVYACRRFDSMVGKIGVQNFKEIFLSPRMRVYREIENLAGCKDCELLYYCRGCHAVSAGTTGSFFDKDPQCWRC
jgi:radical SAM/SPASM domain protein of ACGX system